MDEEANDILGSLATGGVAPAVLEQVKGALPEVIKKLKDAFKTVTDQQLTSAASAAVGQLIKDLSANNPDITAALKKFADTTGSNLKSILSVTFREIGERALGKDFVAGLGDGMLAAKGAFKKIAEGAGLKIDIDFADPASMFAGLKDVPGLGLKMGAAAGLDKMVGQISAANREANRFLGSLEGYRKSAGEISKIQINPFKGSATEIANSASAAGLEGAMKFEKEFAKQAIDLRARFTISDDDARNDLTAIYSGLENYATQLEDLELKVGTEKVIPGVEAIATAARATGIEIGEMTKTVNALTFTMGANGEQAMRSIETIAKASANTILPVKRFHGEVMTAAGNFSDFGDNTEEAAAMLDRFISKADPNRIGASVKAFQSVALGIANMKDEMKAFIGMGTDLAGGGGAIESIVRLDAALKSGDKDALQGIFDEAIARIEELSGAPVMTLQEAVASGQENTFYQQVKMLEQMGLGSGSAQASDIFAASKRGTVDIEAIRAQEGPGLVATASAKSTFGRGAVDMAEQVAGTAADLMRFDALYSEGSIKVMETSKSLAKGFADLGGEVSGTADLMRALKAFGVDEAAVKKLSGAKGKGAEEEALLGAQDAAEREGRTGARELQDTSTRDTSAALSTAQATSLEETPAPRVDLDAAVERALASLKKDYPGIGAGQGDAAVAAELRKLIEELRNKTGQTVQIEIKGELKEYFKAVAKEMASEVAKEAASVK